MIELTPILLSKILADKGIWSKINEYGQLVINNDDKDSVFEIVQELKKEQQEMVFK